MTGLSKRLEAVAGLVSPGMRLADVGTDHGYVPIYLVQQGRIPSAIAMDIGKAPLERAKEHISREGLTDRIETRLSDGLLALDQGEADAVTVAGMGGGLVIHILADGEEIARGMKEFILQPQSEIRKVREYLRDNGYKIVQEEMVLEDGKYYPMMKVLHGEEEDLTEEELDFGKFLLKEAHPTLKRYLEKERCTEKAILDNLNGQKTQKAKERKEQVLHRMAYLDAVLKRYYG